MQTILTGNVPSEVCNVPVVLSSAPTLRMPLASISKVTSIWGTPRGAGGMPVKSNLPSKLLSFVRVRSPSNTYAEGSSFVSSLPMATPNGLNRDNHRQDIADVLRANRDGQWQAVHRIAEFKVERHWHGVLWTVTHVTNQSAHSKLAMHGVLAFS